MLLHPCPLKKFTPWKPFEIFFFSPELTIKEKMAFSHLKHNFKFSRYFFSVKNWKEGREGGEREGIQESRSEGKKEKIYIRMILEGKCVCSRTALRYTSAEWLRRSYLPWGIILISAHHCWFPEANPHQYRRREKQHHTSLRLFHPLLQMDNN